MVRIIPPTPSGLAEAARLLLAGIPVALPTETVYGLAAPALDEQACGQVFLLKGRPLTDPLIVHIAEPGDALALAEWNPLAERLAARFWPGPLTLVLPKKNIVPDAITAGRPSVALRCPAHPVFREVLRLAGQPLAAPSANPFMRLSPTCAAHVVEGLGPQGLVAVVDGGPCSVGVESTIVDVRDASRAVILRQGGVSREEIEAAAGVPVTVFQREIADLSEAADAPGLFARHYSPRTPLVLFSGEPPVSEHPQRPLAVIRWRSADARTDRTGVSNFAWTETGSPSEGARNLYHLLHQLDGQGFGLILAETPPGDGLGAALRDRLRRAAAQG